MAELNHETFQALDDERLGWACVEPALMLIRGKPPEVKAGILGALGEGQRALAMYRVFYDHSHKSAAEYYAWLSYMLDMPGYWSGLHEGLHFFEDTAMISLLEETRRAVELRNKRLGRQWGDAALSDLEKDQELAEVITGYYEHYQQISADSLSAIARYIRAHPDEFVKLCG